MKHYKILSFIKRIQNINHRYDLVNQSGNYICPTLNNDTKIESDFCCEQDAKINSVRCLDTNRLFEIGTRTNRGTVQAIRLNSGRCQIKTNTSVFLPTDDTALSILTATIQEQNTIISNNMPKTATKAATKSSAAKVSPAAPSRSQIKKEDLFKDLQTKIEKQTDIRLGKFFKKNLPLTVKEFLINFFTKYNSEHNTIYVVAKTEQTSTNRRRSLGDLFKICQYYYPQVTLEEVARLLFIDLQKHFKTGFRHSHCSTVKKRVFYYTGGSSNYEQNGVPDEYGNMLEYYKDKLK